MKRLLLAVLSILVLGILVGCNATTNDAQLVTQTTAQLRATGVCDQAGEDGEWWFEYRPVGSSTWLESGRSQYNCQGTETGPLAANVQNLQSGTQYEYRVCADPAHFWANNRLNDSTSDHWKACKDSNNDGDESDYTTFTTLASDDGPPIPSNATLVRSYDFNSWPISGLSTSQCQHEIPILSENGDNYARFERVPGEAQIAGGWRCETQTSTYLTSGEWWFKTRSRYPVGYEPSCGTWCTMQQWHENTNDGGGPVYAAQFFQNGRPQLDGQFISAAGSVDVDVTQWHTYTVHANLQPNSTGYMELWVDGQYAGRTNGLNKTPSNSYQKFGTYSGNETRRIADVTYARSWSVP